MHTFEVNKLTKAYAKDKGIFDVSFTIDEGEVFGFLGPNGAGKTTTIRHLLGFSKPEKGTATILGYDCWNESHLIKNQLGYLPAEISFPDNMTGNQLISHTAKMRGLKNLDRANELIAMFHLDPSGPIKRMSKGMKQKVGIVCAFMHDPKILILDEPTTGLDPLMQSVFVNLIKQEKLKGKSILMSSHIFEEIEGTCDRIAMIKLGKLIVTSEAKDFTKFQKLTFKVIFANAEDFHSMQNEQFRILEILKDSKEMIVEIDETQTNQLLTALSLRNVVSLREVNYSLEDTFMSLYKGETTTHVS